jgi:hypothetical protein
VTGVHEFSFSDVAPEKKAVLENQGIPPGTALSDQIEQVYEEAITIIRSTAAPTGVLSEISQARFAKVYEGEGRNEPTTPVGDIFEKSDYLALFAVTVGRRTSEEITRRFDANDFAVASMLDSAASAVAENAADLVEQRFGESLKTRSRFSATTGVLRYSPGYCGWHISGQKKLFECLSPERIGLSLRASFLMEPLKSVSGVIIAGPREIHNFPISYDFCSQCETRSCRQRLRALYADNA